MASGEAGFSQAQEQLAGGYPLSAPSEIKWLEDGDHDLKPRKRDNDLTAGDHLQTACEAVAAWVRRIVC